MPGFVHIRASLHYCVYQICIFGENAHHASYYMRPRGVAYGQNVTMSVMPSVANSSTIACGSGLHTHMHTQGRERRPAHAERREAAGVRVGRRGGGG